VSEFLYILFSFLPFTVCLVWLAVYAVEYRSASLPKRFLTIFALACTTLYFCHAWFFMAEEWEYGILDAIYLFCNLSVYPLFYCYLRILTKDESQKTNVWCIFALALIFSVVAFLTDGNEKVLNVARGVFAIEVVLVAIFGLMDLAAFDKAVQNYYSDTEGKTLRNTFILLSAFVITSIMSATANLIGRGIFLNSVWLGVPSIIFSLMLFSIFLESFKINFWARDFKKDVLADDASSRVPDLSQEEAQLEAKISEVIESQKLYLRPGLKISDLAAAVGSNRTYVSNAINNAGGMSFSDYVNSRRVEYAMKRLLEEGENTISEIASEAGFASFPSFYRAFVKYTGESPSAWIKAKKT